MKVSEESQALLENQEDQAPPAPLDLPDKLERKDSQVLMDKMDKMDKSECKALLDPWGHQAKLDFSVHKAPRDPLVLQVIVGYVGSVVHLAMTDCLVTTV